MSWSLGLRYKRRPATRSCGHRTISSRYSTARPLKAYLHSFVTTLITLFVVKMHFSFSAVILAFLAAATVSSAAPHPYYPSKLGAHLPRKPEAAPYYPSKLGSGEQPIPREAAPYYPSKLSSGFETLPRDPEALPYYPSKLSGESEPIP